MKKNKEQQLQKRNAELKKQLDQKKHELKIEAALEKVRVVAMRMNKPDDLLKVSETLYKQFVLLGFSEMRNAMINIHNDADRSFINYDYSDEIGKSTNHLTYNIHPLVEKQIKKIRRAKDAFSETYFTGKDLTEWKKFRKRIGEKDDPRISKSKGLYYYFYSIGIGAIGISTFSPISKEKKILLKRFRNVFNLAYQRYVDIANAEAQAKEARIETALERVRAVAMAMHQPSDLSGISETIFKELKSLGFTDLRNTEIVINNNDKETITSYYYSDYGITGVIGVDYKTNPIVKGWAEQLKKSSDAFAEIIIPEKEIKQWRKYREKLGYQPDPKLNKVKTVYYYSYSIGLGGLSISSFKIVSTEQIEILRRFRNVFQLSYQRYTDIALAEAQAREAEIELALERVRAKTMAMQKSDELLETTLVLFQQFKALGATTAQVSICIFDEEVKMGEMFVTLNGKKIDRSFIMELDKEVFVMSKVKRAFLDHQKNFSVAVTGKELQNYNRWRNLFVGKKSYDESDAVRKQSWNVNAVFFSGGVMAISSETPASDEAIKLLERFAKVFDLTFTRFQDLQKAEAQAKEAQIEAALEKVRSCSLAVNNVNEFNEVVKVVFEKLSEFQIPVSSVTIATNREESKDFVVFGCGESQAGLTTLKFDLPYFSNVFIDDLVQERSKSTVGYFSKVYSEKEKNSYYEYVFRYTELKNLPEDLKQQIRNSKSYGLSVAFAKNSVFMVNDFDGNTLDDNHGEILKRFSTVFEQAYIRFLDLQKAEAQAREAQIEAALERVRSRTMAMHQTSELQEVIHTLHKELLHLDISIDGGSFVVINEDVRSALRCWGSGGTADTSSEIFVPDFNMPFCTNLIKGIKSGPGFFTEEFSQEEKKKYFTKLFKHKPWSELSAAQKKETLSSPGGYTRSVAVSKHTSIFIINHQGRKFTETENAILKRFAKVFEQTYTRFLDLQKAEAQAREAQIEIGLERVRSRAMAMQSSEELNALIGTVFTELTKLDLVLTRCIIWVFESATNAARWWMANVEEPSNPMSFFIKYHEHPAYLRFVKEWKNQNVRFVYDLKGKDKIKWDEILFNETELKNLPEVVKNGMRAPERVLLSASFNNFGGINVASLEPLSDEHFDILLRFAKVFDLTYTRFLDLKKAEEQAREAKIEAALERVRSRAMAMHTSQQLKEVAREMRTQLSLLGQKELETCAIHLWGDSPDQFEGWAALRSPDNTGDIVESESKLSIKGIRILEESFQQYQSGKKDYVLINDIEKAKEFFEALRTVDPKAYAFLAHTIKSKKSGDISAYWSVSDFDGGSLVMVTMKQPDEESRALLRRFANVFGLAYKRFKDLQKAEAQAREAQIEAAMERVRSKTMAMHSSQDIAATVDILFQELTKLHVETLRCGISIIHDTKEMEVWTANPDANGKSSLTIGTLPMSIYPSLEGLFDAWKNKESNFVYDLSGQDLVDYFTAINNAPDYPIRYDLEKLPPRQVINCFLFAEGALFAFTTQPLTPEASNIFKRFATLFGQTYRRYLDLQKAEMLAKEATIEAALEKVRGKAMAMHNSSDLSTTASTVFTELRKLGISPIRCGVGLLTKESRRAQLYSATSSASGDSLSLVGWVQLENHPVLEEIYDTWLQQKDYFPELQGEQLRSYYKLLLAGLSVPAPDFSNEQKQFGHFIPFSIGCLYAWSDVKYNDDELKILRRFATIIELTFRRYLELQQLEANAKEAVKQAALDRIRADIASMRTLGDLNRIIPLIWNELTILGLPFIRCGVFIMDNEHQLIHTFLSTPEGKAIAAFHIPYDTPGKIKLIPENWKKKTAYIDHWNDSDFIDFANTLVEQHVIDSSEQYLAGIPHGGFFLHFIPFLQGMMYVGNTTQLSEEDLILIQSVSDAFSTAYARYEDFNKLEAAKKQVDKTLTDLRQTQQQLVQSEKMASLGELTAGIAHEIQNPLNFVNNFSDVSTELLEEMKQELATGNLQQATELADDVIQNLEKILLHGKRADGIVKSMLQHSRASSGKKEPTDINALCDEYLRLSFHGLRAKDKTFNAKFETELDPTIGKINIVGQDIGRVILNLINNAFYAVSEKKKLNENGYEPTVIVSTKNLGDKIEVKVKDNANGIPQKVLDKIFQPFFTTKPTGQGTGLGLSLSYDIITKGHGGEIKVNTKEGEGTEFIIQLPVV